MQRPPIEIKMLKYFVLLVFLAFTLPASAKDLLKPFSAHYEVLVDGFKVGELARSLRRGTDDTWVLNSKMFTTGLVALFKRDTLVERSTFKAGKNHLIPLEYYYHHTGRGGDIVERLNFDWAAATISSLRDGKTTVLPLKPGTLEKQMYQIALREDLAAGKKVINYEVADRGDIRTYRFRVLGEETLDTSLGKLRTIKVERLSHDKKRKTYIWSAIDHDYLVVRLVQEDDGHTFTSYIDKLKAN